MVLNMALSALIRGEPFMLVPALLPAAMGYGLWTLRRWARRLMVFLLWFVAVVVPLGVFNPFMAGDMIAETGQAPDWTQLAIWVGFVEALCIALLHVFGKYKSEFGRVRPAASAG